MTSRTIPPERAPAPAETGRAEIAAFLYHEVTDDPSSSGFQRPAAMPYKHTRARFREDLDAIASGGRIARGIFEIDPARPERHLVLTFDDGGRSAETIAEELDRRGWIGHFFITTSLIGTPTFLDAEGIRRIRAAGHVIGSHSHSHPNIFRALSYEQMIEEWRLSREALERILGEPCAAASVPGGDISPEVLQSANESGIRYLFTSEPRLTPHRVGDCWVFGRVGAKNNTPVTQIREWAHFRQWNDAMLRRRVKGFLRAALPGLYRYYVRVTTNESR